MRRSEGSRQDESARSYLTVARTRSALHTTLALAADLLGFPIGQVNILDQDTQHTLTSVGPREYEDVARSEALCRLVLDSGRAVTLDDLTAGAVTHDEFGCYVGVPLTGREGVVVGTLCLMDTAPRHVTPDEVARLAQFGLVVEEQLDLLRRTGTAGGQLAATTSRDLAAAIDAGQVVPWFQPVVDLATDAVTGYEALARWHHPRLGVLPPARFVPHAEDSDLVVDLDLAVFGAALDEAVRWWEAEPGVGLSVNVSAHHLANPRSLARYVAEARRRSAPPGRVTLELTESIALPPGVDGPAAVRQLREAGFRVVLDDFGTAWSSLEQLLALPVDGVKLDRAVTASVTTREGAVVVGAVARLAGDLDLDTVVEGVETREQARRCRELGCRSAQGYLYSAAVPAAELPHRR
ncbi:hypothetical protein GCM10027047_03380 [Rhodococcus aerolatus]